MEASDHAIFADNDLSLAHVQAWAETARRGRSKLVVRSTAQPWRDQVSLKMQTGHTAFSAVGAQAVAQILGESKKKQVNAPYATTAVACHSVKFAKAFVQQLVEAGVSREDIKFYHGASSELDKRDLRAAGPSWRGAVAVVYTATVSVGVSANEACITHLFAFFTSKNSCATQAAQMVHLAS